MATSKGCTVHPEGIDQLFTCGFYNSNIQDFQTGYELGENESVPLLV